jgi:hypothetical protein
VYCLMLNLKQAFYEDNLNQSGVDGGKGKRKPLFI